ncbi:hypothetical protein JB92DRAFT_2897752 [Gautieria morchelliformis]|nr:hypothetical protein JB92DRAFT_2897708 [Gautieria morchelliformis]KAF8519715.1 hypothetical protein JB92DRAFT_2897752 [Gautieria morchelliformis]
MVLRKRKSGLLVRTVCYVSSPGSALHVTTRTSHEGRVVCNHEHLSDSCCCGNSRFPSYNRRTPSVGCQNFSRETFTHSLFASPLHCLKSASFLPS